MKAQQFLKLVHILLNTLLNSSAVDEIDNRIKVNITTNNEADLAKVLALDTIGGAIVIECSAGIAKEDLAVAE